MKGEKRVGYKVIRKKGNNKKELKKGGIRL